jgi:hypothetical protein
MNRKLVLWLILVMYCCTSSAQPHFGVRGALVESTITSKSSSNTKFFTGFNAGFFAQTSVGKRLVARTELSYLLKGVSYGIPGSSDSKLHLHNISIPILIGLKANKKINVFLGPQVDFLLKAITKASNGSSDITSNHKSIELSGAIGASCRLNNKLGLDFRYTQGLTPVVKFEIYDVLGGPIEVIERKSYVFQLGLSYLFK